MNNVLTQLEFTAKDIEKQLAKYEPCEFFPHKELKLTDGEVPKMAELFCDMIFAYRRVPSQKEFFEYYLDYYKDNQFIKSLDEKQLEGLKARVYKSYPSFLRDIHFGLFLTENADFKEVVYNINLDIDKGVDILVRDKGKEYAVRLYTNTPKARRKAYAKSAIHEETLKKYIVIDLPITLSGNCSNKINNYCLYDERYMKRLYRYMNGEMW